VPDADLVVVVLVLGAEDQVEGGAVAAGLAAGDLPGDAEPLQPHGRDADITTQGLEGA
jgi:hypothetical protein